MTEHAASAFSARAELLKEIDRLPPRYVGKVFDFVAYLQKNHISNVVESQHDTEREWVNPLLGLGKAMGSTLTLDLFMEMQQ